MDNSTYTSVSSHLSSIVLDKNGIESSMHITFGETNYLFIDKNTNIGINTLTPAYQFDTVSTSNNYARYTNPTDGTNADFIVDVNGRMGINASGEEINTNKNFNVIGHNGTNTGLKLAGTLVVATANQLNYTTATQGVASSNKALITDSDINISNINSLSASNINASGIIKSTNNTNATSATIGAITTNGGISSGMDIYAGGTVIATIPIVSTSGGNGYNSYSLGDLLVGNSTNTLSKLNAPSDIGYILTSDTSKGTYWAYNYISKYYSVFTTATIISSSTYSFGPFYGRDSAGTKDIALTGNNYSINLNTFGINGIGTSSVIYAGLIYPTPNSTMITGINTTFITDLGIGTVITVNNQTRKILSVINDTSATIDTKFTILNSWVLGATGTLDTNVTLLKFGIASFNGSAATTANAIMTIGTPNINYVSSNTKLWTIEFWLRPTALSAQIICASGTSNTMQISMANNGITSISLGQGSTFNIANGLTITGTMVAGTYKHIAIVFTGTSYVVYVNGVVGRTVASTLAITSTAFNTFYVGANGATAFNGHIDEFRLSKIARYATTFAVATSEFTFDANTLSLNHFNDISSISASDDASAMNINNEFTYDIDIALYPNTVYYGYAITDDANSSNYVFNSDSMKPQLPTGYTTFARIPFYALTNASGNWIALRYSGMGSADGCYYGLMNPIVIVSAAANVTPTIRNTSLINFTPSNTSALVLLITHTHVGTVSAGIVIGNNTLGMTNTIMTTASASTTYLQYTLPLASNSFDTYISAAASTTNYTIQLLGFFT